MRNRTIDIARGIGILLIVLGHNGIVLDTPSELYEVIYSFHYASILLVRIIS